MTPNRRHNVYRNSIAGLLVKLCLRVDGSRAVELLISKAL
nr:MAG TPA: hypothetical protein [Caudoviricetes sp.]